MPPDHRDYRAMEVCILGRDLPNLPSGHERAKEGDFGIREPLGYIGTKEASHRLWLLIEGLDLSDMLELKNIFIEGVGPDAPVYEKHQYCIPLKRLKEVAPFVDLARVRDPNDKYQPFLPVDLDVPHYRFGTEAHGVPDGLPRLPTGLIARPPLDVHGLVFNKKTMRYL